jgi:hypothetical protein
MHPAPIVRTLRVRELLELVDMKDEPLRAMFDGRRPMAQSDRAVFSLDVDAGAWYAPAAVHWRLRRVR